MSHFWKVVLLGAITVLAFDTAASWAAKELGFPYTYASVGSALIYVIVGYFIFRQFGVVRAIGAALVVAIVDATLGWFISWQIGPGAPPADQATVPIIAVTMVFLFVFAAACAAIGSAIARVLHGRRPETNA